jgi:hypothetical protein
MDSGPRAPASSGWVRELLTDGEEIGVPGLSIRAQKALLGKALQ